MEDEFQKWVSEISKPSRFLLVEDDAIFVDLLTVAAQRFNCEIVPVTNVQDAVNRLQESQYKLVIVDEKLPGESGMALLRYMHKNQIKIPAVILSGNITTMLVEEARNLGLVCFIGKPTQDVLENLFGLFRILNVPERNPTATHP